MDAEDRWYSLHYTLNERCWGFVVEHSERGVYAYERGARWVVPSFHRFEHTALFVRQFAGRPTLELGGSHDLAPAYAYATGALEEPPEALEDTWWFLLYVAQAARLDDALAFPTDGEEPRSALRECFEAFRRALEHLDG
jgi:hypothetical protein